MDDRAHDPGEGRGRPISGGTRDESADSRLDDTEHIADPAPFGIHCPVWPDAPERAARGGMQRDRFFIPTVAAHSLTSESYFTAPLTD